MVEVLKEGYQIPLLRPPPLSSPKLLTSYVEGSEKRAALDEQIKLLLDKGAVVRVPRGLGFYSRMFLAWKSSGSWRPIIDLSIFNKYVKSSSFQMETVQSVLLSIRQNDWMVSIDLRDAYLQVPIHPQSQKYLRFCVPQGVFQFRVLCFGLTTAPQVFTRVMAPVAKMVHSMGVRLLRYLDDWLILASTEQECLWAKDQVLQLCQQLGIVINPEKSSLVPSQRSTYLGMILDSRTFTASPTPERVKKLRSTVAEFLSSTRQPARSWQVLLGVMASLIQLLPGARLRMRSLQIQLRQRWSGQEENVLVEWNRACHKDLLWWSNAPLERGRSLLCVPPDLSFWSDASDEGWGAHLGRNTVSGRWSPQEKKLSINLRELKAIHLGLRHFAPELEGRTVAVQADNTTALAYIRNAGGTRSTLLNKEAQSLLHWAESKRIGLVPQFIQGKLNVLADSLSRAKQIIPGEWTLNQKVVDKLGHIWPAYIDLFATYLNHRLPAYFSPMKDASSNGVDAFLQKWDHFQAYAFPPFSIIRQVLNKIRQSTQVEVTLIAPFWPQREWFADLLDLLIEVPRRLPDMDRLLVQTHNRRGHRNPQVLRLHAWRLSSVRSGRKDSVKQWRSKSPLQEGPPL